MSGRLDPRLPQRKRHKNSYWLKLSAEERAQVYAILETSSLPLWEAAKLVPPRRKADGTEVPPGVGTLARICRDLRQERMLTVIEEDDETVDRVRSSLAPRVREEMLDEIMDLVAQEVRQKTLKRLDPSGRTAAARLLLKRADQWRLERHQEFLEAEAKRKEAPAAPVLTEEVKEQRIKDVLGVE